MEISDMFDEMTDFIAHMHVHGICFIKELWKQNFLLLWYALGKLRTSVANIC